MSAPLHGLLLAGGRSTRMGRDKATLEYHGRSQLETAWALLAPRVGRCFLSVRPDQVDDPARAGHPQIVDGPEGVGPAAGLLAAQRAHPQAAWLVLACDLPFLDGATLDRLLAARDPAKPATAFRSAHDGLPEPLCAVYEPSAAAPFARYVAEGRSCPRKFLIGHDVALIALPQARALDNVNSADEYWTAMQSLAPQALAPRPLEVRYFALLREQAGLSRETLTSAARTPRELYEELRGRHGFTLPPEMLKVAVNGEFGDWGQPLSAGDSVVFIPPVAGG
ncbi:MAG: molybdenum cofactor biosynthesis protein MoaAD [Gammaproteobacteria bacterium]|nr:molybdenum cofactor biosynthesis protein MoaAD [Gammaproteobacteria bacterium]